MAYQISNNAGRRGKSDCKGSLRIEVRSSDRKIKNFMKFFVRSLTTGLPQPITVTALIMPRINKVIVLVNEITVTALIAPRINKENNIF